MTKHLTVTIPQYVCPICTKKHEGNEIWIGKRLTEEEVPMHTPDGAKICPECHGYIDSKLHCMIVVDESKSKIKDGKVKLEDAYRTGKLMWTNRRFFMQLFNVEVPFAFIEERIAESIQKQFDQQIKVNNKRGKKHASRKGNQKSST